jgi:hypothetical protein
LAVLWPSIVQKGLVGLAAGLLAVLRLLFPAATAPC